MKRQLTESEQRQLQYKMKILGALNEVFQDEDSENFIGMDDLSEGNNATEFIHVLSNIVPNDVYHMITGHNVDNLQFNHISNTLCFQYMAAVEDE